MDNVLNRAPRGHERTHGLRIGVLVASESVPSWQRLVIEQLASVEGAELCVIGVCTQELQPGFVGRNGPLWRIYQWLAIRRSSALRPTDISGLLSEVPRVHLNPATSCSTDSGGGPAGQFLAHRPDVVLDLRAEPSTGEFASSDVQVWRMQHGEEQQDPDTCCIWELVDGSAMTQVYLKRFIQMPGGESEYAPLAVATFQTVPHNPRRNIDQAYLGAVELPAMACRTILAKGDQQLRQVAPESDAVGNPPRPDSPSIILLLFRLLRAWVRRQMNGLVRADRWHVGLVFRPIESLLTEPCIRDVEWFARPEGADRYVADPFGVTTGGSLVVLVEDFDHRDRHGRIGAYRLPDPRQESTDPASLRLSDSGSPDRILSLSTHASYPYIVKVNESVWCIPETSAANEVRAFEFDLDRLALRELGQLLGDVALVDPTVFEWGDSWWLFGTDRSRGANTHLRAWWAEHPKGPWIQHAIDPLCIDVRWARGAGTPFVHEGVLYRPAQDCSRSYGGSVAIRRVLSLDRNSFEEDTAVEVRPDLSGGYPHGLHTISQVGDSFLVDGSRHRFSTPAFLYELRERLRRTGRQ